MILSDYLVRNEIFEAKGGITELIEELNRMGYGLSLDSSYSEVLEVLQGAVGYEYGITATDSLDLTLGLVTEVIGEDGIIII